MINKEELSLTNLQRKVEASIKEHRNSVLGDGILYNGGTALVLLATTVATLLPENLGAWIWLPRVLTGFATFWIAVERILNFGARWRFHVEMLNSYRSIGDMLDYHQQLPDTEKGKYREAIWRELFAIRRRESGIPGVTAPEPATISY